jgi:hypothetical protein
VKKEEAVVSEKERFETFLKEKNPYGLVIIRAESLKAFAIIKMVEPVVPHLQAVKLGSFFHPIFNLKIKNLSTFLGKKELTKKDLSRYIEEGLLSFEDEHGPDAPLTFYTTWYRLPLITKCEKVLKYDISRIKLIIELDNVIIRGLRRFCVGMLEAKPVFLFQDLSGPPIVFLRKYLQWYYDFHMLATQMGRTIAGNSQFSIQRAEKKEPGDIDLAEYLAGFDYENASKKEKDFVNLAAFALWLRHEMWKISHIEYFHGNILSGYSPQVLFEGYKRENSSTLKPKGEINWKETLKLTKSLRPLSFFRTPDFEVELVEIFNLKKVDSSMMRKIEKVYSIFRQRLGRTRKRWGEKTGIREEKEKMNKLVQEMFKKMREETSLKVPEIFDEIRNKGVSLSDDSLKRLVYGIKKKG